ncbi:MAG: ABC transporter substrate-binding protein [Piscirickettsiaceae bacterium]|nr:ABC transporter substrate-binding protein [Piscirickettsiaceae bacterium]
MRRFISCFYIVILCCLTGCDLDAINSPYAEQQVKENTLYSSFALRPKHLDPARSYSSNEVQFNGQIYEPPLQYHYLKRPYELEPLTATKMPTVHYLNESDERIAGDDQQAVAYSVYTITIRPGIQFQPHPAFARDENGMLLYHALNDDALSNIQTLSDFEQTGSRELVADDYVYQIKRLASPKIHSPILGLMSDYIVGLSDYAAQLREAARQGQEIDLRAVELSGVRVLDRYRYEIKVFGRYPQLQYWLAMPFFSAVPWEADALYKQPGLIKRNITMDWFPVGTGPYRLTENNPNSRMVMEKNPHYRADPYPSEGEIDDEKNGLLIDAGQLMPFVDKVVFLLEKEQTSYWNKFLQGYYDVSGISSDSFEQAIQVGSGGEFGLSDEMAKKGVALRTAIGTSTYYMGFNMQDEVVGGLSDAAKKLRQAISIAIDYEEYISIFLNGRGIAAQGPIPPGIFGYEVGKAGVNSYVYQWEDERLQRQSIEQAKSLLVEAGYPEGREVKTGEPLTLYLDVPASGPEARATFDWLRKQFQKLGIQLVVRSTDYNRFQDKMRSGQAQLFQWGWNADYPDPENFFFLLYGPNSKASYSGENAANYNNPEFDRLFEQMKVMPNTVERQVLINNMLAIIREDSPWIWGYHPKQFSLYHTWNQNVKPNLMANNTMKYRRIDAEKRFGLQQVWNRPILWPLLVLFLMIILLILPASWVYFRKNHKKMVLK